MSSLLWQGQRLNQGHTMTAHLHPLTNVHIAQDPTGCHAQYLKGQGHTITLHAYTTQLT